MDGNKTGYITQSDVDLRKGAGTDYSSSGTLSAGTEVTILCETTESDGYVWYVVIAGEECGCVRSDSVELN